MCACRPQYKWTVRRSLCLEISIILCADSCQRFGRGRRLGPGLGVATVSCGKSGRRHKLMDQVRNNNTRFRAGGGWEQSMGCHIPFFLQWLEAGTAPWQQRSQSVQLRKNKTFHEGQHLLPESHACAIDSYTCIYIYIYYFVDGSN